MSGASDVDAPVSQCAVPKRWVSRRARPNLQTTYRRLVLQIDPAELLHALPGIHLRREYVALPVGGDVVQRRELADLPPGPAEARKRFLRGAVDDAHLAVHAVDHVDEGLRLVGREHEIIDGAGTARRFLVDVLSDERAVLA